MHHILKCSPNRDFSFPSSGIGEPTSITEKEFYLGPQTSTFLINIFFTLMPRIMCIALYIDNIILNFIYAYWLSPDSILSS